MGRTQDTDRTHVFVQRPPRRALVASTAVYYALLLLSCGPYSSSTCRAQIMRKSSCNFSKGRYGIKTKHVALSQLIIALLSYYHRMYIHTKCMALSSSSTTTYIHAVFKILAKAPKKAVLQWVTLSYNSSTAVLASISVSVQTPCGRCVVVIAWNCGWLVVRWSLGLRVCILSINPGMRPFMLFSSCKKQRSEEGIEDTGYGNRGLPGTG